VPAYQIDVQTGQEISPADWDAFVRESPQGSLYVLHGYLTAVAPDWQALILYDANGWKAVWPLNLGRKWRFQTLFQPVFSQYGGIMFAPIQTQRRWKRLQQQRTLIRQLFKALPDIHFITIAVAPELEYLLPFHWEGYQIRTRYTYHLLLEEGAKKLYKACENDVRRRIRLAQEEGYYVAPAESVLPLETLIRENLDVGRDIMGISPPPFQALERLGTFLLESEQGRVLVGYDGEGNPAAAGLFGYYKGKWLYLVGAFGPGKEVHPGAAKMVIWEGIKQAAESGAQVFDFEGSMIEGVEASFRQFNAHPVPYLQLYKNELPLWVRWIQDLRS